MTDFALTLFFTTFVKQVISPRFHLYKQMYESGLKSLIQATIRQFMSLVLSSLVPRPPTQRAWGQGQVLS